MFFDSNNGDWFVKFLTLSVEILVISIHAQPTGISYAIEFVNSFLINWEELVWFLCLMTYQPLCLMPKPFSKKNSSGTI